MGFHPRMASHWYSDSDSSRPIYFDILCRDFKHHRFQIKLQPDLSAASLHDTNTSELFPQHHVSTFFHSFRISEDYLVSFWHFGVHYGGVFFNLVPYSLYYSGPAAQMLLPDIGCDYNLSLCTASGRSVRLDTSNSLAVLDFF